MVYSKRRNLCGILSLTASLAMLGCGSSGNSFVRAVNASQGAPGFTVQVGQIGIVGGLPYGTEGVQQQGQYASIDTSGNYRRVEAGANQSLSIYSAPGTILASTKQAFLKNTYYTIVVEAASPNIMFQTLTDDDTAPTSGNYKLRVMDVSTEAGPVNVYTTAASTPVGGSLVVGNMQFQSVTNPYLQLSPGAQEVYVTPAGNPSRVLASAAFTPASGKIYSIFFFDPPVAGATNYSVIVVNDPVSGTATTTM